MLYQSNLVLPCSGFLIRLWSEMDLTSSMWQQEVKWVGRNRIVSRRICRVGSGFSMYFSIGGGICSQKGILAFSLYPFINRRVSSSVQAAVFLGSWEVFKKVFCSVCIHKLVHFSKFIRRKKTIRVCYWNKTFCVHLVSWVPGRTSGISDWRWRGFLGFWPWIVVFELSVRLTCFYYFCCTEML